jgi:hypothetical protein
MVDSFIANARVEEYVRPFPIPFPFPYWLSYPFRIASLNLPPLSPFFPQPPRDSAHTPLLDAPKHCPSLHKSRAFTVVQPQRQPTPAPPNPVLL